MSRTYEEGVKDGMVERITEDLEAAASRIAILEEELEAERAKKWSAVSKLKMIEHHKGNIGELRYCLENGEALTLHDKIELIKEETCKIDHRQHHIISILKKKKISLQKSLDKLA